MGNILRRKLGKIRMVIILFKVCLIDLVKVMECLFGGFRLLYLISLGLVFLGIFWFGYNKWRLKLI